MPEVVRVYNSDKDMLYVSVEPWGTRYELTKGDCLSIHVDSTVGLIEISEKNGIISIFLNDGVFDDLTTAIVPSN